MILSLNDLTQNVQEALKIPAVVMGHAWMVYSKMEPASARGVSCESNSECVVKDGTAMCDCKLGYKKSGSICIAQDPCTSSPCSPFAVCKSLGPRKYQCTCKEGYQGDGRVCQPINPCVDNNGGCPENSTNCIYKGPGEASCVCKPGMTARPPSQECFAVASDCRMYFCDISSTCEINSHGNPSCVCKQGEIGDGRSCYKDLMSEINKHNSRGRFSRKLNVARKMFASGCSVLLTKYGPFTVFVPSLLPINDKMEFNGTTAAHLCRMHIVPGLHLIEDMVKTRTMWTLSGHQLTFSNQAYTKSFRYQDVPGELYNVLQSNLPAANGVIHVVDTLRKRSNDDNLGNPQKTIGEILASTELFSRFETILENCGLPAILDGPGPFTVFVPSNDGVDKLRDGRLIYLFTEGINKLQELVKHHIYASAALTVEKLMVMPHIITMANQILSINISADGRILMDDSEIPLNMRNIVASNGIIHTVDGIFIPPSIIPILPHRCNEEQHKIVTELTPFPKECVYIHDPQGLNVLKRGCARYCNQTIMCSDGIDGNGNCQCFEGFKGIACHICSNPNKHGENCDEDCGCVHGVCDNRPGSGGVCQSWSCKEGYTGKFCDKTSKNCGPSGLSQYCHQNAVCSLNDTARCICMDGYEGDGFSCQPVDLCSQAERGGCSQNALCTSTGPGKATCQCNVGWTGDGKACVAIDNCMQESRGNCHINADCIYIGPGQSKCVCKRGYAGDGHNCDAINPCLIDNGGCHDLAMCVPLGGGERSCACPEGYVGDGMTCYGDVLKKSAFSIPSGTNVTVLVPSEEAIKSLNKSEKDFWLTPYTLPFLVRAHFLEGVFTDEKLRKYNRTELPTLSPRTRWQINTESGVFTIQNASLVVSNIPASNGIIHILSKVLLPPLGDIPPSPPGLQKQLNALASFSTFKKLLELIGKIESSEKYTVFVPGNNSIEEYCHAANVTQLDNETVQFHIVLGEKLLPTDLRSGIHKNSMLGLSYWLMFYQNSTQKFVNNVPLDGKFFETRNGILIGVSQVLQIQKNRCTANTTTIQRARCGKCEKGIKCPPGSVLVKSVCCPGYYGHMCEMCPGKPGQWCSGNGECLDGIEGSGECQCQEGFHGTACEMCEVGRYGADCKSGDSDGYCSLCYAHKGRKVDPQPLKQAHSWWATKSRGRIEVDSCNSTCHQMANCLNASVNSPPMCFCSAGYTGNGTHCTEIDPCTTDHGGCSIYAVCTKVSPGERTCVCKEGYAGDGTLCREIDLCLESNGDCHTNAECVKTGPGKNNGGCSPFGLCKYTGPGTRNCSCSWHSVGDGFTCRGKVYQFKEWKSRGLLQELLRYHMVGCQKLLLSDLEAQESLTSLSGHTIKITEKENSIYLNEEAKVVMSDIVGVNGVIHFINKILIPSDLVSRNISSQISQLNITEVAETFGYTIYSKLLKDAGLLPLISNPLHRPFTMLWPTDAAFNALPQKRQEWLYHREHRGMLASYLKAHMIRDTKGKLLVGNGDATIIQRHMEFNGGIAYGIDRLLEPPDLGSRCDEFIFLELQKGSGAGSCPVLEPLENVCGSLTRTLVSAVPPTCSPPCHARASCHAGNLCECDVHYEGDGRSCTAIDMCSRDNGGCATHAACTQLGVNVSCTCTAGYWGDGYVCEPIDRCADGRNGDCSEHAHCISTGPNKRRCECKQGYIGDGIQCLEEAVPPVDRCLDSNGQCHREAICTDLHFHDKTMGVFHLQSPRKKYDFTYAQAQEACAAEGAALATFQQLAAAQQMGFHLCLVGWMENGTAGYPTAFPTPSCGANRVGIVDYGPRNNLSETWDAFCYREKDVTCACPEGFIGDGVWCRGGLPDVLAEDARFSTFYSLLLAFANDSAEGMEFFTYLSDGSAPKTLFVPVNSGFADNEADLREDDDDDEEEEQRSRGKAEPRDSRPRPQRPLVAIPNPLYGGHAADYEPLHVSAAPLPSLPPPPR
ncbi:hypothetical protein ASZ78_011541 [Callipepla squamata]|uniref:Stabilin-1 n=1 Tax=Callipepla squamata TaxID=9009 RepID=A0A226MZK9_CALSU|nr:hypothetical protein ASZ78_011541 [Callipepla squamata]